MYLSIVKGDGLLLVRRRVNVNEADCKNQIIVDDGQRHIDKSRRWNRTYKQVLVEKELYKSIENEGKKKEKAVKYQRVLQKNAVQSSIIKVESQTFIPKSN